MIDHFPPEILDLWLTRASHPWQIATPNASALGRGPAGRATGCAAPVVVVVGQQLHPAAHTGRFRTCLDDGSVSGDDGVPADGDADGCLVDGGYRPVYCCFVLPPPPDVESRNSVAAAVADIFGVSCAVVSKARISPGASGADAADVWAGPC